MTHEIAGSPLLRLSFALLTFCLGALFVGAVYESGRRSGVRSEAVRRRTAIAGCLTILWIAATALAAARGALHFSPPPTMLVLFVLIFGGAIALASSRLGRQLALGLPLAALVGYQGFRVVVELLLHRAYVEGLMPVQMSYSGRNFDIISGVTALALGGWLLNGSPPRWIVLAWNTLGLALLANIVTVAFLSAPTPLRVFMNEPANVWITHAPWVWLPAVMVFAALSGHVLVYRRLISEAAARAADAVPASAAGA
jgi:hypothetical protein